ncbi:hypothetical protein QL285_052198 [Trifolium repens]|nr:hypothetical protein QL285_052198 [Trifolium repens]
MRVKDVEKILIDEPDEVNEEEAADQNDVKSEKEMDVGTEKERRSKKRNERPSSDDEDNPTLASEPNMTNIPEAQSIPPQAPTIDFTKPISMILPKPQPETVNVSSSSEDTSSDYSIERIINRASKIAPAMSSESQEVVSDDNSIMNHLSYHMFGDAFTSSTLNSPAKQINHATPMHIDSETIIPPNTSTNPEPQIPEDISEIPQENPPEPVVETHTPQVVSLL